MDLCIYSLSNVIGVADISLFYGDGNAYSTNRVLTNSIDSAFMFEYEEIGKYKGKKARLIYLFGIEVLDIEKEEDYPWEDSKFRIILDEE